MHEVLNEEQIHHFIHKGFIRIDNAFSPATAAAARDILWRDLPADPDNPATWTQPVIRLGMYTAAPFIAAANTPVLHRAFDQLVGEGRWLPCTSMGTFPVRFPAVTDPGDTGWHVDTSFPGDVPADYMQWRSNIHSKGRALLMLFLFSDVEAVDAPTRIRIGSHLDVARVLEPAGERGLSVMELADSLADLPHKEEAHATGKAGTVYLCHPFLAHAAQPHHGTQPRFLAQPPLFYRGTQEATAGSPVWEAIQLGLNK